MCPGYDEDTKDMTTICNGHGTCDLAGECACEVGYIGDQCQFRCPSSDGTSCVMVMEHALAEVNIRIDTYNGTSATCENYANIEQCEGYAILNDLPVIDVAGIYEIGENEICNRITAKQCELWGMQELYYNYTGEIIDPTKPLGCILNRDTNAIQFNKETSLANTVECGIDYNCLCQKSKPDIMYCKINEDNVLIHEMGGDDYTSVNGRWLVDSYEDNIQIKTTPGPTDYPLSRIACAKYACTLGTCTVAKTHLLLINLRLVLQLLKITINHVRLRMHVLFCVIMTLHVQDIMQKMDMKRLCQLRLDVGPCVMTKQTVKRNVMLMLIVKVGHPLWRLLHTISHVQYEHVYNLNRLLTFLHFKLPQLV